MKEPSIWSKIRAVTLAAAIGLGGGFLIGQRQIVCPRQTSHVAEATQVTREGASRLQTELRETDWDEQKAWIRAEDLKEQLGQTINSSCTLDELAKAEVKKREDTLAVLYDEYKRRYYAATTKKEKLQILEEIIAHIQQLNEVVAKTCGQISQIPRPLKRKANGRALSNDEPAEKC